MAILQRSTMERGARTVIPTRRSGGMYYVRERESVREMRGKRKNICVRSALTKNEGKYPENSGGNEVVRGRVRGSLVVARTRSDATEASLAEAQKRWDASVRNGRFMSVTSEEIKSMLNDGWVLLDVRPEEEVRIARVSGAVNVPLFRVDKSVAPGSLIKQMSAFGMGGWWLGTKHMVANTQFMKEVSTSLPPESKGVIVACQKGLRSLAACERLANAGYGKIAWLNGGYDMSTKGDLDVIGADDIRYAGIGGVSSLLGWTEVQQEEKKGLGGGVENVLKIIAGLVAVDACVLLWEQASYLAENVGV